MPNQTVIRQWVDALRSGEYTQTRGKLHRVTGSEADGTPAGMCCLGVLCALASKADVVVPFRNNDLMQYGEEVYILPRSVFEWAGFPSGNPEVEHEVVLSGEDFPSPGRDAVTVLNDDYALGFLEIADAIEDTYLVKSDAGQPA